MFRKLYENEINSIVLAEQQDISVDNILELTEEEIAAFLEIVRAEVSDWTYEQYLRYWNEESK